MYTIKVLAYEDISVREQPIMYAKDSSFCFVCHGCVHTSYEENGKTTASSHVYMSQ